MLDMMLLGVLVLLVVVAGGSMLWLNMKINRNSAVLADVMVAVNVVNAAIGVFSNSDDALAAFSKLTTYAQELADLAAIKDQLTRLAPLGLAPTVAALNALGTEKNVTALTTLMPLCTVSIVAQLGLLHVLGTKSAVQSLALLAAGDTAADLGYLASGLKHAAGSVTLTQPLVSYFVQDLWSLSGASLTQGGTTASELLSLTTGTRAAELISLSGATAKQLISVAQLGLSAKEVKTDTIKGRIMADTVTKADILWCLVENSAYDDGVCVRQQQPSPSAGYSGHVLRWDAFIGLADLAYTISQQNTLMKDVNDSPYISSRTSLEGNGRAVTSPQVAAAEER